MVNLIMDFKDSNRDILLGMLFIFMSSCSMNKGNTKIENTPFLEIHFQDFFKQDMVGLKINDCNIFNAIELTSDSIMGATKIQLKIYRNKDYYIVKYLDKRIICPFNGNDLKLSIAVNNNIKKEYLVEPVKGKYIGFSKKDENDLYFYQSPTPFQYD